MWRKSQRRYILGNGCMKEEGEIEQKMETKDYKTKDVREGGGKVVVGLHVRGQPA